jgi:outer membrane protein assembly factor BamB
MIANRHIIVFIFLVGLLKANYGPMAYGQGDSVEIINQTFLGNWQRNYYGNDAPSNLDVVWKHYLGEGSTVISRNLGSRDWKGAGWTGQPLMIREGKDTFLIQGAYDHHLKKISASDGTLVWQYKYDDVIKGTGTLWFNETDPDPEKRWIILQGSRLGAEEDHFLDAPKVYSFRAISYMTGKELWRHNSKLTSSYSRDVDASAMIVNDTAYIGLENSYFTVFNPDPDSAYKSKLYNHPLIYRQKILYTREDVISHRNNVVTEASPCKIGRMIYVSSGAGHVWGYNMDSKELEWDYFVGSDMDGSPVVTFDSCLLITVEKQYIDGQGGILKLDPSKKPEDATVWYMPVPDFEYASWQGGIIGSAAVTDNYNDLHLVAAISIDGKLNVVRHNKLSGEKVLGPDGISSFASPDSVFSYDVGPSISTPLFTGDRLVACGYNGIYLFSYDEDGNFRLLDRFGITVESTPFIYNNHIYIASRNGYLYCLGTKD